MLIDDFEAQVEAIVTEFDPRADPRLAELRSQFTDREWGYVIASTEESIRLNARLAVFAKAVGDEAVRLGLDSTGRDLSQLIAFDGASDVCDSFRNRDDVDDLPAIFQRLSMAENEAYDNAETALVFGAVAKALGSLDEELTTILND